MGARYNSYNQEYAYQRAGETSARSLETADANLFESGKSLAISAMAYIAIAAVMYVSMQGITKYGNRLAESAKPISEVEAESQDSIASRMINQIKSLGQKSVTTELQEPTVDSLTNTAQSTTETITEPAELEPKPTVVEPKPITKTVPDPSEVKQKIANEPREQVEKDAKAYIFQHESGFNQYAVNPSSGACGLGQSLPCHKLTSSCRLDDYKCQDDWFENYMHRRYGTWQNAVAFWKTNRWW